MKRKKKINVCLMFLLCSYTHLCVIGDITGLLLDLLQLLLLHESQLFLVLLELFCCEH